MLWCNEFIDLDYVFTLFVSCNVLGYHIVGLDACYTDHKGKVALKAERCADIIIPESPDPVLTSCGVVLLYQDPESRLQSFEVLF